MARRKAVRQDDRCPREIDEKKKPNIKIYPEYDERIFKEGNFWILEGYFEAPYSIPLRATYKFGSIHARYRLLLKSEIDKSDPNTGQVFPGDNRAAQFNDGHFETADMFNVRGIYRSAAYEAGRIWDEDTKGAEQRESSYQHMKSMLLGDKDFTKRLLVEMAEKEETDAKEAKEAKTKAKAEATT